MLFRERQDGVGGKCFKEGIGKRGMVGVWVCKETHGISAGARPLMIHSGTEEVKNHNKCMRKRHQCVRCCLQRWLAVLVNHYFIVSKTKIASWQLFIVIFFNYNSFFTIHFYFIKMGKDVRGLKEMVREVGL